MPCFPLLILFFIEFDSENSSDPQTGSTGHLASVLAQFMFLQVPLQWHFRREPNSLEFSPFLHLCFPSETFKIEKRTKFPGIFLRSAKTSCHSRVDVTC